MRRFWIRISGMVWLTFVGSCSDSPDPGESASSSGSEEVFAEDSSGFAALIADGTALYRRAEFDSVIALTGPGLEKARASSDSAAIMGLLLLEAYVAYQRSDYPRAREIGEEALAMQPGVGSAQDLARADNLLGLIAWQESRFADAIEWFAQTGELEGDGDAGRTLAAINLGNVHTDLGNLAEARAAFGTGLELSRARGDERREAIALNNLGMLLIRTGDPLSAIPYLEDAIELFRAQGADNFEANALGQMGTAYTAMGQIREAISILDEAVRLSRDKELRQEEASNLEALAEAYQQAGDFLRALRLYQEAEGINREIGLVWETGSDQRSRARIYDELGEMDGAREAARQALETHRSVGARWEELADILLLADLSHRLGDVEEARRLLDTARTVASGYDARAARLDLALTEARMAQRSGDAPAVLDVLARVEVDLSTAVDDRLWVADMLRAKAYAMLGLHENAVAAGRQAVDAVERTRSGLGSAFLRNRVASDRREAYETLVQAHLAAGDTSRAFEVSDQARGRALLEYLALPDVGADARLEEAARRERMELLTQIAQWSEAFEYLESFDPGERDEASLKTIAGRISEAQAEAEALRVLAVERDAAGATLLGERHARASRIRDALGEDEVLLEYLVGETSLIGFVVTREAVRTFVSDVAREDLLRRVRIARGMSADPVLDHDLAVEVFSGLFEILVAPARNVLRNRRRLVIVPDGVLSYLPFAALVGPESRYLVEDHDIRLVPSASALPVLGVRDEAGQLSAETGPGVAFAPLSRSLPATRREAEAFRDRFPGSRALLGGSATEARVREALSQAGIVHIATHGVMNVRNPTFSRLELAAKGQDPEDDGRLEVHELFTLRVRSPLVFLSGCETGLGAAGSTSYRVGQDFSTLAQAFLYSGAGSVVATLWRVEDEGAAVMADLFYGGLVRGLGPAEALAGAQRILITDEDHGAPYYWAAYQLTGGG